MVSLGKLRHTFQEGRYDKGIAKFIKLCNIVVLASTILCAVSVILMPVIFFIELGTLAFALIFIVYTAFYLCLYGSAPAIILLVILHLLFKKYRTEKLNTTSVRRNIINLLIAVTASIATGFILLAMAWH